MKRRQGSEFKSHRLDTGQRKPRKLQQFAKLVFGSILATGAEHHRLVIMYHSAMRCGGIQTIRPRYRCK